MSQAPEKKRDFCFRMFNISQTARVVFISLDSITLTVDYMYKFNKMALKIYIVFFQDLSALLTFRAFPFCPRCHSFVLVYIYICSMFNMNSIHARSSHTYPSNNEIFELFIRTIFNLTVLNFSGVKLVCLFWSQLFPL